MKDSKHNSPSLKSIRRQASAWMIRLERGLTPDEQDDFSRWLGMDMRHGETLRECGRGWNRLDQLRCWQPEHSARPNPDLLAVPLRRRLARPLFIALSAAALVSLIFWMSRLDPIEDGKGGTERQYVDASKEVLADGSVVRLNAGAQVQESFTPNVRHVVLSNGEAHFTVTHDPTRPFVVTAHGVDIRAVGTAFNVRVDDAAVEVLVTEGRVRVGTTYAPDHAEIRSGESLIPILEKRQRAVVSFSSTTLKPEIATLTQGEIDRVLAWKHPRLDFKNATLGEIVAEFNRHNEVQISLPDTDLAAMRVSVSFRSDNIDGFVRLIESGFGARCQRRDREIILTRLPQP